MNLIKTDMKPDKKNKEFIELKENSGNIFAGILSAMADLVFVFDTQFRFIYFNTHSTDNLFLPPQQFLGKIFTEVMPSYLTKQFINAFEKTKKGKNAEFEYQLEINGNKKWFDAKFSPFIENGQFKGAVALIRDITTKKNLEKEKKIAFEKLQIIHNQLTANEQQLRAANQQLTANEQQLRAANQQLTANEQQLRAANQQLTANEQELKQAKEFSENLLETAHSFIVVLNTEANIILFNKYAENLTGYKKEEVLGKNWLEIFIEKNEQEKIKKVFYKTISKTQNYYTNENSIICKNGHKRYVSWANTILHSGDGKINGVLSIGTDITQQKKMENELKEKQIFLQSIFDGIQEPMHIIDDNYKIVLTNKQLLNILNTKQTDILGKYCYEIYQKRDIPCEQCAASYVFNNGKPKTLNKSLLSSNGNIQYYEVYASPLTEDKNGKVTQVIEMTRDITDRIKSIAEIKRLSAVIETTSQHVIITDIEGKVVYVNRAYLNMSGYNKTEVIGGSMFDFSTDEGVTKLKEQVIPSLITKGHWQGEMTVTRKDHSIFPAHLICTLLTDEHGNPEYFVAVFNDITYSKHQEQVQNVIHNITKAVIVTKNMEEFLKNVKMELDKIIDTTNFYVALYDEKSDTFSQIYNIDQKNKFNTLPANKSLITHIIKTKKPLLATPKIIKKLINAGEIKIQDNDAKVWLGVPLILKKKIIGVIAVQNYKDKNAFTKNDLKVLEIVSHQISILFERKNHEEVLKKALIKAKESDRLKSAFLANMSHEIRTPMNSILGFTDLLKGHSYSFEERQEIISIIDKSGKRLLNTVNDIIDISKIETGQISLNVKHVNINQQIENLYKTFIYESNEKNLELSFQVALKEEDAFIKTDENKLISILSNLIKNAIKYTDKGKIDFGYEIIKNNNNKFVKFYVKDTGIGVPESRQQAIFNRFEQADIEDKRAFQGSGLGLSISKSYVEILGGTIWLESVEGKGSRFNFTIPFKQQKRKPDIIKTVNNNLKHMRNNKNLKILIAEDEMASDKYLTIILNSFSNDILHADNGKDAVDIAHTNPDIDIILMDMKMPLMSGFDAARKIRGFNNDVIIIAQTAYALVGDEEKALEAGCNYYISKPIDKDELINLIKKLTKNI